MNLVYDNAIYAGKKPRWTSVLEEESISARDWF